MLTMLILLSFIVILTILFRRSDLPIVHLRKAIDEANKGNYKQQINPNQFKECSEEVKALLLGFNELLLNVEEEENRLRKLAYFDKVTGVSNRHAFEENYYRIWNDAIASKEPLSIILVDIDNFKEVNDSYGHHVGDVYLTKIAQTINDAVEELGHLVSRYGGDEFVVVAANTDYVEALLVAEKIRHHIEKLMPYDIELCNATVSIGIADTIPVDHEEKENVVKQADRALYMAKYQGRNNIVVQSDEVYG